MGCCMPGGGGLAPPGPGCGGLGGPPGGLMPGKPWGEPAGGRPESNAVSSNEAARIMTLGASCMQVLSWLTGLIRCTHSVWH